MPIMLNSAKNTGLTSVLCGTPHPLSLQDSNMLDQHLYMPKAHHFVTLSRLQW